MNETLLVILAFIAGLALGILFFGGLWFTVKKTITAKTPAIWFFSSFFLRVSIVLIGFYFVSNGNWQRLLTCLLGFVVARFIVMYFTRSIIIKQ
jgi:F1F0 ATPase subunit 2